MHRRGIYTWLRAISSFLVVLMGLWPSLALAHTDPPGPPTLIVMGEALRLYLKEDQDDGFDGNAELMLMINITHETHGSETTQYDKDDYNWDHQKPWLLQPKDLWTHVDCTPRNEVTYGITLIEVDADGSAGVGWTLASAAAGIAASAIYGAVYGSATGPGGTLAGAAAGTVVGLIGVMNGNDDLGAVSGNLPENGHEWVRPRGSDGGADIKLYGRTGSVQNEECLTPPPPLASLTPGERATMAFAPLQEALAMTPHITAEPGNPGGLTAAQVADIRLSLTRLNLGLAEALAGAEIEEARGLAGVDGAIELFLAAREMSLEDPVRALSTYRDAFTLAATSLANGEQVEGAPTLPFQVAVTPDFLATRANRNPAFLALVLGADSAAEVVVDGLPPGVEAEVVPLSPSSPVYRVELKLGDVAPERYSFQIRAFGEEQEAARTFTLVVNPTPHPEQDGVTVPAETEGNTTIAAIDPSRDQAFQDQAGHFRLKIPANAIGGTAAQIAVTRSTGANLEELLSRVNLPAGVRPLEGLAIGIDTETGPVTALDQAGTLSVAPTGAEQPSRVSLLRIQEDGTVTDVGGRLIEDRVTIPLDGAGQYLLAEVNISFDDLVGHWARPDVELMAAKSVIRGIAPGQFDPAGQVTRAQFAALLVRALRLPAANAPPTFSDVSPSDWFYAEVAAAAEAGLIQGMGDGTFAPHAPVTREQVAVMLSRALAAAGKAVPMDETEAGQFLAPFADQGSVSAWARTGLGLAIKEEIMRGQSTETLAPQAQASRAEAAVMIARFWRW